MSSRLTSRFLESFPDPLGRWLGFRVGNQHHSTIFISAYRPCKSGGESTVYQQQRRACGGGLIDPCQQFFDDLSDAIAEWHTQGYLVVLGMDLNEDVLSKRVDLFLINAGLWNPLLETHGPTVLSATHSRNCSATAIDAIFCTRGLTAVACGISTVGQGCPSDHVQLWADFEKDDLFGPGKDLSFLPHEILNSADPAVVDRYKPIGHKGTKNGRPIRQPYPTKDD